jgi:hypothetical protein
MFLFEKQNQETFASGSQQRAQSASTRAACNRQKFFASFFKKEVLAFAV